MADIPRIVPRGAGAQRLAERRFGVSEVTVRAPEEDAKNLAANARMSRVSRNASRNPGASRKANAP